VFAVFDPALPRLVLCLLNAAQYGLASMCR
jgi:hypothetical protein